MVYNLNSNVSMTLSIPLAVSYLFVWILEHFLNMLQSRC